MPLARMKLIFYIKWKDTKMENKKYKIIYNQSLAGFLMMRRFVLINMRPDNQGSGRNVFFFVDSPELQKAINEYKA